MASVAGSTQTSLVQCSVIDVQFLSDFVHVARSGSRRRAWVNTSFTSAAIQRVYETYTLQYLKNAAYQCILFHPTVSPVTAVTPVVGFQPWSRPTPRISGARLCTAHTASRISPITSRGSPHRPGWSPHIAVGSKIHHDHGV